ncbi:hypothetical protein SBA3_2780028 [Candidatus Sulfopaludibacter sp. SbA3]|nr:hypothetical protein SBA3_2780028 [Candidatus Sulfopaludibacter sp. SbA3]
MTNRARFFSREGPRIAFTGEYGGNVDVFVMPAITSHRSDVLPSSTVRNRTLFSPPAY